MTACVAASAHLRTVVVCPTPSQRSQVRWDTLCVTQQAELPQAELPQAEQTCLLACHSTASTEATTALTTLIALCPGASYMSS